MAFQALSNSKVAHRLFGPGNATYRESVNSYWSRQEAELEPSGIFRPHSADEISAALGLLHDVNVRSGFAAPFAVRAGGYQAYPGSANIQSGLTIDLRQLKHIQLCEDRSEVTVGAGCTFEDVYGYLDPLDLSVAGARVAQVGVTGFILGGGLSYYSPHLGFACDNVTSFTICLANGEIRTTSTAEYPKLHRALKGGGNNFGIVTAVTLRTIPKRNLWGGLMLNAVDSFSTSATWLHHVLTSSDNGGYDRNAAIMIGLGHVKQIGDMCYHSLKYTEPTASPAIFKGFLDQQSLQSTMREASHEELAVEEGKFSLPGERRLYQTVSFSVSLPMLLALPQIWRNSLQTVSHIQGVEWSFVLNPILPSCIQVGEIKGGNALGLCPQGQPEAATTAVLVLLIVGTWDQASDDAEVELAGRNAIDRVTEKAIELGVPHKYLYMNYAWRTQDVLSGYGEEMGELLKDVGHDVDPEGLFQRAVPGGFKIPR
ncbi:MAG: hypothetical protein M1828_000787 [Chrysothrix sp. TS-e1954]|nr:MAG: hypothetical protein M1828_000787 [Chrysothrix sp. TS-e1954]